MLLAAGQPIVKQDSKPRQHQEITYQSPAPTAKSITRPASTVEQAEPDEDSQQHWQDWFWPPIWSNWILAGVAIGGICVAIKSLKILIRQTVATKRAAEATRNSARAMEKSVELQEVAFRQWLAIENWQDIPYMSTDGAMALHVKFEVINPTKFPLTLICISTKIGGQNSASADKNLLPPDHHYTAAVYIRVTEEQLRKRDEAKLVLPIAISITYEDILEKEREYPKNGMLAFSKTGVSFHTFHGPGIYMERKEKEQ